MSKLVSGNIKDIYKLSPMQEGMYFHFLYNKLSLAYFEQMSYRLHGDIKIDIVEKSLNDLVQRYDILRTVFNHEKLDIPLQIVLKDWQPDFYYNDIRFMASTDEKESLIEKVKENDKKKPFDLNKDSLIRIIIIQLDETEFEFIWSFHHIIMDGWCIEVLISDFFEIYFNYVQGQRPRLPEVTQYRTFIEWLEKHGNEGCAEYWGKYLEGFDESTGIPKVKLYDHGVGDYKNEQITLTINETKTAQLSEVARKNGVTLNTIIQSVWGIVLARYNAKQDVIFGTVVSGRPPDIENIESMVGLFINTIPVRINFDENTKFLDLTRSVQENAAEGESYNYYPLPKIQGKSSLKHNLIDHILVFENFPIIDRIQHSDFMKVKSEKMNILKISKINSFEQTSYNLNIIIAPGKQLTIVFNFNANVYDIEFIDTVANHFDYVLNQLIANPEMYIQDITLLSNEDKQKVLYEFNNTACEYPSDKTIQDVFQNQAKNTPNDIGLIFNDSKFTYNELNSKANQLARLLRSKGVNPNSIIGIITERSPEMMIGILGILKSGGAYLPIDPTYPKERIAYMLSDAQVRIILTQKHFADTLNNNFEVIDIQDENTYTGSNDDVEKVNKSSDLAYVIYTSGSTGKPKGTMIEHSSVINRLNWMQKRYPLGENDIILQKTPYTFDVSVWELFWWFFNGAKVCIALPDAEKSPQMMIDEIKRNKITIMHFVPSMLNAFLFYCKDSDKIKDLSSLRLIFSSGEILKIAHFEMFKKTLYQENSTELINLYGPTEATVDVSYFDCPMEVNLNRIPIGKPIDNTRFFVVNNNQLQPIGVPGELYISGDNIARGYLNKVELTSTKFIDNPFEKGSRCYKTGDFVRWLPDGNIEYLGRIDQQVKIRGYRIELEEIESALMKCENIVNALVTVSDDANNDNLLCAYVVVDKEISVLDLREGLGMELPDYMIPAVFIQVNEFPVTANGKVDRRAIKELSGVRLKVKSSYVEPKTDTEKIISEVWRDILNVKDIGVNDNFFELGGTSFDIIKITSKLKKIFKKEISVVTMFTYPTIAFLSQHLTTKEAAIENPLNHQHIQLNSANDRMRRNVQKIIQQRSFVDK